MNNINNSHTITIYNSDGSIAEIKEFNAINLIQIDGMLSRCTMKNGEQFDGFVDIYRSYYKNNHNDKSRNLIYFWTWDNIDEDAHRLIGDIDTKFNQTFRPVEISQIHRIDAILYSNPRWGGRITNRFYLNVQ